MNNGTLKIEKGIPIPDVRGKTGKVVAMMKSMKVGESFLFPISKRNSIPSYARQAKVEVTTRAVDDDHIRVWRMK